MRKLFILIFFTTMCSLSAQELISSEHFKNPLRPGDGVIYITQSVPYRILNKYYYDVIDVMSRKTVVTPRLLSTRDIRNNGQGAIDLVEERFITTETSLRSSNKRSLSITWNMRRDNNEIVEDGEYLLRIYITNGNLTNTDKPEYFHKITVDKENNAFKIKLKNEVIVKKPSATVFKRPIEINLTGDEIINSDTLLFAEVIGDDDQPVEANKWTVTITENTQDERVVCTDSFEASRQGEEIGLQYIWNNFQDIRDYGKYDFTITIENEDSAGNYYADKAVFSVLYVEDIPAPSPEPIIIDRIITIPSVPFNGDFFDMQEVIFNNTVSIHGEYSNETNIFTFLFTYSYNEESIDIKTITFTVLDESNKTIYSDTTANIHKFEWDGKDKKGKLIIMSDTVYTFRIVFNTDTDKRHTVTNKLKTELVTSPYSKNEYLILLPGIYFPGFVSDILRTGNFRNANLNAIWKAADLLHKYLDEYDYLIIRAYSNYTTYPTKARMKKELPALNEYSEGRAKSVRDLLATFNVPVSKIKIMPMSPDKFAVDPNAKNNYLNRRIEFYLQGGPR